jgi:hypothetical protein
MNDGWPGKLSVRGRAVILVNTPEVQTAMFFRSEKSLVLAAIVVAVGCFQLYRGWIYADAAKREAMAVGTIVHVVDQDREGFSYEYLFNVNGVNLKDESNTCDTPLTSYGCKKGATVRVYYDPDDLSVTLLEEFRAAGRGRLFFGTWMVSCGALLIVLYFFLNKMWPNSGKSDDPDDVTRSDGSDTIHIVTNK